MAVTADKLYATILKGVGGLYTVRPDLVGEDVPRRISCSARGKLRSGEETPYPGDRVELECSGGAWAIARILERKNALRRPTVANVTHLAAVIPAARPKPDLMTADKLILYAESAGIEPIVVVNKSDIAPDYARHIAQVYENAGYRSFLISALGGEGTDELRDYVLSASSPSSPSTVTFSGASGVGKSTLMTKLFPELSLATGAVSRKSERGRHTTRTAELFEVADGLFLADTPGFTMLDFARYNFFPSGDLAYLYREFEPYIGKCKYTKCTHLREEGCAVIAAGGGMNAQNLFAMGQQNQQAQQQAAASPAAGAWKCSCGTVATGKFCPECGSPKPADEDGWKCSCGTLNKGKFCENCGAKKPDGVPLYRCDKCGWEPEDPAHPPKFCPECGDPFDESDRK